MDRKVTVLEVLWQKEKYFCIAPFERAIGTGAEDIWGSIVLAKMKKKKVVILVRRPTFFRRILSKFKKDRITNKELFDVQCPGVICPSGDIVGYDFFCRLLDVVYVLFALFRSIIFRTIKFDLYRNSLLSYKYQQLFEMPIFGHRTIYNPDNKNPVADKPELTYDWSPHLFDDWHVQLRKEKDGLAREIRSKMGIPLDAKYACLHVRDSGFHRDEDSAFRCSDIADYECAIDYVISQGYWVVRLGDARMKPAPFKKGKFIDYAFSEYRSDLMDMYFLAHCELFLGSDSGPVDAAILFQKDILFLNLTNWNFEFPVYHGNLALMKYYYSQSRKRFLSVSEILDEPYGIAFWHAGIGSGADDYIIMDNTSEDLRKVVEEWFLGGRLGEYTALQKAFAEKRRVQTRKWIADNPYWVKNPQEALRWAFRINYQGTLGAEFLRKNWEYGENLSRMTEDFHRKGHGRG